MFLCSEFSLQGKIKDSGTFIFVKRSFFASVFYSPRSKYVCLGDSIAQSFISITIFFLWNFSKIDIVFFNRRVHFGGVGERYNFLLPMFERGKAIMIR